MAEEGRMNSTAIDVASSVFVGVLFGTIISLLLLGPVLSLYILYLDQYIPELQLWVGVGAGWKLLCSASTGYIHYNRVGRK